jgi:predicted metal-binding protein
MSAHTPGPWSVEHTVNDRVGTYHIPQVAQHTKYMPWTQLCAEEQANTRLIAAAPALLEALEAVLAQHCEHWEVIDKLNQRTGDCLCAVCQQARVVVRAAKVAK